MKPRTREGRRHRYQSEPGFRYRLDSVGNQRCHDETPRCDNMAAAKKSSDKGDEKGDEHRQRDTKGRAKQRNAKHEVEPDGGNTGKGKPDDEDGRRSIEAKVGETRLKGPTKMNSRMQERTPEGQTSGETREMRGENGGGGKQQTTTEAKQRAQRRRQRTRRRRRQKTANGSETVAEKGTCRRKQNLRSKAGKKMSVETTTPTARKCGGMR